MDFQAVVDAMSAMTCVVSVERLPDDRYGKLRIVTGNKAYIDSIEHPAPGTQMLTDKFVPDQEYTNYLTRDLNFEDFCYRAAVKKKCLHSYVHPDRMDVWFNMMFLPIGEDEGDLSYCLYMMEINFEASSERLSTISAETASSVLDTCIRLRGTNDFVATMKDVVAGIRELCSAEFCCIMTMNEFDRSCQLLAESMAPGSRLLSMQEYLDDEFYDIAESWTATIAGSNCLIAKNEQDMEVVKERNPAWYRSLTGAGANTIVLFPLKSRNQLLGYMWAINFDPEKAVKIKETLEVTTFILGSELGNYLLLDRLRLLGSKDMLTGVMNRNEMNSIVDGLCRNRGHDKSVGVIFADLNGLKEVNDAEGHNAGDLLLKNAAAVLREVFEEKNIFRAGGDEFAIIVTGKTEKELQKSIEKIRDLAKTHPNLSFALGGSVEEDSCNVRVALRAADERMYEDKKKFYASCPEKLAESRRNRTGPSTGAGTTYHEQDMLRKINFDPLTGLPSMSYFFKLAEQMRREMHKNNIPSAFVFINLNGLKSYNLKYGFAEGDSLLREFSKKIISVFGEENCSRFGQDHFAVFTERTGLEKKLEKLFRQMKKVNGGKTLPVRAGVYPDSMGLIESSLACDRAKYACDALRDDYSSYYNFFNEEMLAKELNRQYIVDNLDRAINENWITAYYQPIVRATSRKVCDEEALARWIDPQKGMMSPVDFIPILEDTRLIYKVDLRIVDIVLERLRNRIKDGQPVVPVSVNLSRTDFEMCDIVEEICNRVDVAGISHDLITIEITESVIGENFEFMKEQIGRFQKLGFKVWMDDFGSGYSSLDLLQDLQFDLIKFDMRFMRQFDTSPKSRVILAELMRMAVSLNIETVTEGVETAEQVEFLCEIGCTKMQGYYFCKPISLEELNERNKKGEQISLEDPAEAGYHKLVSSLNLYDLGAVSSEDSESIKQYFNTQPMSVCEYDGSSVWISRCNKSYRDFATAHPGLIKLDQSVPFADLLKGFGAALANGISECSSVGQRVFINEITREGETVHAFVRKICDNPVTNIAAYAIAVLGITPKSDQSLTFTSIVRALSADYIDIYHVDLETEEYTQYSPDSDNTAVSVEKKGKDFFNAARMDALSYLYEADQGAFIAAFTKENIVRSLDENNVFTFTYRLMIDGEPQYVNMKAVRMNEEADQIIIGISNVNNTMKQQEAIETLREESATFSRISVLLGDFIAIYTVDPVTGVYMEYSASSDYAALDTPKAGTDFFGDSIREVVTRICEEDMEHFMFSFSKSKMIETIEAGEIFVLEYRLMLSGGLTKVCLKAGMVQETDGPQLIVGVFRA